MKTMPRLSARTPRLPALATVIAAVAALAPGMTLAQTPGAAEKIMAGYVAKAGAPANAERGQEFFNRKFKGGLFNGCTECHTDNPTRNGRDQTAEKTIRPLAPAAYPSRFTDAAKVEHQFRLNCKDTVGRDCTAQEKADVMAWLISLKP